MFKKKETKKEEVAEPKAKPAAAAAAAADVIEAMGDGLIVTDLDGNIISMNKTFEEYLARLDIDVKGCVGKSALDLPILKLEEVEKYVELMKDTIEKGRAGPLETLNAAGEWISVATSLLKDSEGNPSAIFAVVRDVTELKKMEEERVKAVSAAVASAADREKAGLIDAMPTPLVVTSLDGEIIYANSVHVKMFGYKSADEIVGKCIWELKQIFVDPEKDIPRFLELFNQLVEKGHTEEAIEIKIRRTDGTEFFVSASGSLLRDTEGNPKNIVAVLRDITELKRAEEERARAAAITKMVDAMIDAVIVLDLEGNAVSVSRAFADMFGHDLKYLIGKPIMEMPMIESVKPEEVERFMPLLKETIEKGRGGPVEFVFPTKDGKEVPVSIAGGVIRDADGNPTNIVAVLRDITELKRLQEKEKEASAMKMAYETIEAMPDALAVLNLDGEILSVNSADLKLFGYKSADEIIGKSFDEMRNSFVNPEEDIPKMLELFGGVIEKGFSERPVELKLQRPDGSKQYIISTSAAVIRDVDGNPINVVAVLRDITELKRLQEKEKAAAAENARAEEAEKYSKELEKKIRDLERFQKVTMDREKRILELKKEIKELKKQLEMVV